MFSVEEIEKTIATMRNQANALNTGADALEQSLVPIKAAQASIDMWNKATGSMIEFWSGKSPLTKPIAPFILYDKKPE